MSGRRADQPSTPAAVHRARRTPSGLLAASVGATVAAIASLGVAIPLAVRSSDSALGWFHDPEGALVFVAALIVWVSIALGAGYALKSRRHDRAVATAALTFVAVPIVTGIVASTVPMLGVFVPAVAAAGARAIAWRQHVAGPSAPSSG